MLLVNITKNAICESASFVNLGSYENDKQKLRENRPQKHFTKPIYS